jgi:hypothetical protein
MAYATLVFSRIKYEIAEVEEDDRTHQLTKDAAEKYYELHVSAAWKRQQAALADLIKEWKQKAVVRDRGRRAYYQEVVINGEVFQSQPGQADQVIVRQATQRFVQEHGELGNPPLPFPQWFLTRRKEVRSWRAEMVTASDRTAIELPADLAWDWGYPVAAALAELDRLEIEGWKITHVSEDHGLYQGADATEEAFLTRVRYLLHRP